MQENVIKLLDQIRNKNSKEIKIKVSKEGFEVHSGSFSCFAPELDLALEALIGLFQLKDPKWKE